jgi:hypothetical protein
MAESSILILGSKRRVLFNRVGYYSVVKIEKSCQKVRVRMLNNEAAEID